MEFDADELDEGSEPVVPFSSQTIQPDDVIVTRKKKKSLEYFLGSGESTAAGGESSPGGLSSRPTSVLSLPSNIDEGQDADYSPHSSEERVCI